MADDPGFGKEFVQQGEKVVQDELLFGGAIVFVLRDFLLGICHLIFDICHLIIDICKKYHFLLAVSAFGTHSDTASVVARDVAASEVEWACVVERTVATDVEVITGIGSEAALGVIALQLFYGVVLTGSGVGAM